VRATTRLTQYRYKYQVYTACQHSLGNLALSRLSWSKYCKTRPNGHLILPLRESCHHSIHSSNKLSYLLCWLDSIRIDWYAVSLSVAVKVRGCLVRQTERRTKLSDVCLCACVLNVSARLGYCRSSFTDLSGY
jgi:hypothetical protein